MTESIFFMLKEQNTKEKKKYSLLLTKQNNTVALIWFILYSVLFVHSISRMLLLNMPIVPENKALFVLFVYYVYL